MSDHDASYQRALSQVEASISNAIDKMPPPISCDVSSVIEKSESTLDAWDYCFAIAIGSAGIFIATNEEFARYLEGIHQAASGASGDYDMLQSFLGKVLSHKGDHIDQIERPFKNRDGGNAYPIFHRLLWGHDILSIKADNPFYLMFKQKGLPGILQAVRHLLADTASKQGLPLPGSSFLDVVDENNSTSNYLIKIAQKLSEETVGNKTKAQEIYSHLATIRAQDVVAGVVVKAVVELYFILRSIDDELRRAEIRLIAYAVNFFGEAAFGCIKQNGVPYINIPLATAMTAAFCRFCYLDYQTDKRLVAVSNEIFERTEVIISRYEELDIMLPDLNDENECFAALEKAEENYDELIAFFSEDER